ncbi:unnamed protein product [Orchesella dallaii]|uniref:Uncharacterized protein n=1 Tax=Orchesella dallaii TaxID=48710 RepID=A0ABP1RR36_9HEXA
MALKIQECCTNIPVLKSTRDGWWRKSISEIVLPPGKFIRAFVNLNCEGEYIDVAHGVKANFVVSTGFNDIIQSFKAVSKEMAVTPCQDQNGEFELHVTPTCTIAPDPGITDVVVPNDNCICLFDQPDCTGEDLHVATNSDYDFIINAGFNDRTRSYRACNRHIQLRFVNDTR